MPSSSRCETALIYSSLISAMILFIFITPSAQAGTLDPTFGYGGEVVTDFGLSDYPAKVLIQPDGKIVVAGYKTPSFNYSPSPVVARYNGDGSLDSSFGNNGVVVNSMTGAPIYDALLQPDGKIVLVGGQGAAYQTPATGILILRYNSNGTPDLSFNGGSVITSLNGAAVSAALQPDGKILVLGKNNAPGLGAINLVRYNSDATLDQSFGVGGISYNYITNYYMVPGVFDLALLPDGKFLINGYAGQYFLARFTADGTPDPTFGMNGFIYSALFGGQMILQPDGKIIFADKYADTGHHFTLVRMNSNGSVDTGFGLNGTVTTNFGSGSYSYSADAVLKSNGEIIAIGSVDYSGQSYFAAVRYTGSGALLAKTAVQFSAPADEHGINAALQPDGKIVLTGYRKIYSSADFATARLLNITDNIRPYKRIYDFNGDQRDELILYRPGTGGASSHWYDASFDYAFTFGTSEDIITPADFTGDGLTELAVFRPSTGYWYIARSYFNAATDFTAIAWGTSGDLPVAGDYDGDGRADIAVFRPSNGIWYILNSRDNTTRFVQWGVSDDQPVVGDYDGDGKADAAVFRPSNGTWYVQKSSDNQMLAIQFGQSGDHPVQNDYDADYKTDFAVYRPSNGTWYVLESYENNFVAQRWGAPGDIPAPGDYDGDSKTDFAVYRPAERGVWYIMYSGLGTSSGIKWGAITDIPVPGN